MADNIHAILQGIDISGPTYLKVANVHEERYGHLRRATERRQARQDWLRQIKELAEPMVADHWSDIPAGTPVVALCDWSRDCDMCEGTSRRLIEADAKTIDAYIDHALSYAEGPTNFWLQRPSDAFESEFHDRALEAYEDGHPHIIYA